MTKEEWKIIEGYDGYMVSNYGRVMTIKTGYIHEYDIDVWGYYRVCLSKNGVKKHPKRLSQIHIIYHKLTILTKTSPITVCGISDGFQRKRTAIMAQEMKGLQEASSRLSKCLRLTVTCIQNMSL